MTYRSDHDAALARVAALEAENAQLKAALEKQPSPDATPPATPLLATAPPAKRWWTRVWLQPFVLIPLVGGMAGAIRALTSGTYVKAETDRNSRAAEELHACAVGLAGSRAVDRTFESLARTTACREAAHDRLETGLVPPVERGALAHWIDTEDVLAAKVSTLTTYYKTPGDHPLGESMWREVDVAFEKRQDAVTYWLSVR